MNTPYATPAGRDIRSVSKRSEQLRHKEWSNSYVLFALECLEGRIDFAEELPSEFYWPLEEHGLDEAKRLKAYFVWESGGSICNDDGASANFCVACSELRKLLSENTPIKKSSTAFGNVRRYIEEKYGTSGDSNVRSALVAEKAYHVFVTTGRMDETANWLAACIYVDGFYGNIVSAVRNSSPGAVRAVLEALRFSESGKAGCSLTNCFEAAVAFYFLKSDAVKNVGVPIAEVI